MIFWFIVGLSCFVGVEARNASVEGYDLIRYNQPLNRTIKISCDAPYAVRPDAAIQLWDDDNMLTFGDDLMATWYGGKNFKTGKDDAYVQIYVPQSIINAYIDGLNHAVDVYFLMINVCRKGDIFKFGDVLNQKEYNNSPGKPKY
uniref:Uncharacterized protein n=1 Tax=Panagrolaimus sp. JU765 TaxID=591449 RepID=A0AC34REA4_9BILA